MLRPIRSRLIVSYLLLVSLAMGVAAALTWTALDRAFLDVLRENLLSQARRVAQTIEASGTGSLPATAGNEFFPSSGPYSQSANVIPGYHTRVIDDEGAVILDLDTSAEPTTVEAPAPSSGTRYRELEANLGLLPSDARDEGGESDLLSRPEVQRALGGQPGTDVRSYTWAPGRRILYAAYPIQSAEASVTSIVYIASPLPRLNLSLLPDYLGMQVLGAAGTAVLLAGLAGLLLARQFTRPIHGLTNAASALARGESVPPISSDPIRELDHLATAFNTMNTNLTAAHGALADQARQREAILESLADAVLASDATGEIILANPAASALLKVALSPVEDAIRRTLTLGEACAAEITARGQVIELLVTPLTDEGDRITGAVAVGHDVTAYRQLDRLRTDFVSDVSHELRTPLTALKGTLETLQDAAADDVVARERFLQTAARETERLIRLTNDLLVLARAGADRLDLRLQPTDLTMAARGAVAQFKDQADKRGVTVTVEPPGDETFALADADRIHQVLVNLLSNAIRFTPAEGTVSISIGRTDNQVSCTVFDTGPGIPAQEIPQVFERFYRGDRSRTRPEGQGGTGLGLAIVKAIVEAHGGRAWAENAPDRGAAVTFTLPPLV